MLPFNWISPNLLCVDPHSGVNMNIFIDIIGSIKKTEICPMPLLGTGGVTEVIQHPYQGD